ncbi:NAD(P)-binding domain-containing protein [Gemmatimonas phototrophica]|uniref:Glutamyl-tRNA reductase n=1 Tax=Gemmatimonas phototrophica TaxID=1379270 RepID=A0A143BL25_9BACT|nr:NAD(P)-binding domain-containing protein [Gemmatimonas phototrophica]AMW05698.1 hypothetical protein GEMMAAP_14605 [Gemmatimonas phototrophica]
MFLLPFHVVGCTHEANPADLVGRVRLSHERLTGALAELQRRNVSAVIVSTCHRTELYWWGDGELHEWFAELLRDGRTDDLKFERADADLAVRHLFAVAAGMKSARFGEPEILGQIRRAWMLAQSAGTSRGPIDGAFRQAIDAARHIRADMGTDADASLGELVHERLSAQLGNPSRVLVLGSGDAARGVLQVLRTRPIPGAMVSVTSRTDTRAATLAAAYQCPVVPWGDREGAIRSADAVVFAVHVTSPLVSAGFEDTLPTRYTSAVWIDLGVPAAVHSAFAAPQVDLVTLAALETQRGAEVHRAQWRALHEARHRRAAVALQQELARYARATHRHHLGARLGALEEQALAVATSDESAPVDEMVRKVTRLVLRELSRA